MSENEEVMESMPVNIPAQRAKISEQDRMALEVAKANKKTAIAQAEKAIAQNETAELAYKYTVLQIYMKYGLTEADALTEGGDIIKNGALKQE
jgi:hypothetical protein